MKWRQFWSLAALQGRVSRDDGQRGALSLFVAITFTGMVLVIALIVDASGRLDAGVQVDEYANEAARAGIQQINAADAVSGKSIQLNCAAAKKAARGYLASAEQIQGVTMTGTFTCIGTRSLLVEIKTTYPTKMLTLIGIDSFPLSGSGEATLVTGQRNPDLEQP